MNEQQQIALDQVAALLLRRSEFLKQDHTDKQYIQFLEMDSLHMADTLRHLSAEVARLKAELEPKTGEAVPKNGSGLGSEPKVAKPN